jgi:hypothetical protein
MTRQKRGGSVLAAPDAKRQQDVLSTFFKKSEKDPTEQVAALESTSAGSTDPFATPAASLAGGEPCVVSLESGVGIVFDFVGMGGIEVVDGSPGPPAEKDHDHDEASVGEKSEAVGDGDGTVQNSIPAGQPSPMVGTCDLASFCDSIGEKNFPRLTMENLNKLEVQFKEQTQRLQKQVGTLSDSAMTPMDRKRLAALEESTKNGSVNPRSTMGGVFRAAMKATEGEAKQYAGMTRQDAAEYRMNWLKKEYKKFHEERVYSKTWKRVDTTKGKYLSASQLVLDDGGWNDKYAVEGAQKLIEKAIAMGDPWVRIHPQTGRTLFLKLNFEFEELFEESWSNFRREMNDGNLGLGDKAAGVESAAGNAAKGNTPAVVDSVKGDEEQAEGLHQAGPKPKPKSPKPDKVKDPQDKAFDEMWKQALMNKKLLMTVVSAAREIDDQITTSDAWSWAKNDQNQGKLTTLSKSLRAEMTEFHRGFLAEEPGTIRKRHAKELVMVELTNFNKLKDKMSAVGEFVKTMQRRHLS